MYRRKKSLGVNAVLNVIKTIFSIVFPLITYPYAARVLQVANVGKVDFSNSVVSYFILFAGLGMATYAIREGSMLRDNKEELELFASEVFSINMISSIISLILLFLCVMVVPKFHDYSFLIAVQSFAILGNLIGINWYYVIVEDYAYITIRSLVVNIVALILMFLFVKEESDYIYYAAVTVVANIGANIFNFIHAKKYINIKITLKLRLKKHLKPIMIIFASVVTTTIYVNSDKTILGFLVGDYYVGLYSISVNIYFILKSCVAAIILVSLPRLSNYIAISDKSNYEKTAQGVFNMFFMVLLPVITGIYVVADNVILIIAGKTFMAASTSLKILSISLVFSILSIFYTNAVLLPFKKEMVVLKGTILSALINIILNFFLLGIYKQNGAAFTTLIAEIVMCAYQYIHIRSYITIRLTLRYFMSILVGCLGIICVSIICNCYIHNTGDNLGVTIILSMIIYGGSLILFKNETVLMLLQSIKAKWKSFRSIRSQTSADRN